MVVNYANSDMVGHTGDLAAAITAVEAVDRCLGRLADAVGRAGTAMLITADHGNAETMRDRDTDQPHTAHTLNPVPLVLLNGPAAARGLAGGGLADRGLAGGGLADGGLAGGGLADGGLADGRLADVAPTVLVLMGIEQPAVMTGRSLLKTAAADRQVSTSDDIMATV